MTWRTVTVVVFCCVTAFSLTSMRQSPACCPVSREKSAVINTDQTVIILWDAASKTQHFIRKASFTSEADDFGFLIPTPGQPQLEESSDSAFTFLAEKTKPAIRFHWEVGLSCAKTKSTPKDKAPRVEVLEEKRVAGFQAAVLKADSAEALIDWLRLNGYVYSPAVEAWARPYHASNWLITALKVAKQETNMNVTAKSLRLSFQTERPLFPYREPSYTETFSTFAKKEMRGTPERYLRIYFLSDARYRMEATDGNWSAGRVAWAGPFVSGERTRMLEQLRLPVDSGPSEWWLTEFEGNWPYRLAESDVYFSRDPDQTAVQRPPQEQIVNYGGFLCLGICAAFGIGMPWVFRSRRKIVPSR